MLTVVNKGLFLQNVIAVIWDFDKTLSPHYMQRPLFETYGVDEAEFWSEVNALPAYYAKAGITVHADTCYLGHLLTYVRAGIMPDLSNAKLRELGRYISFFPGVPEIFGRLEAVLNEPRYQEGDLRLEHYVVSTGLAEMIRGSKIAPKLSGVWASEFIEEAAEPRFNRLSEPKHGLISQIAGFLDNTTKTRAIFEINKGVNRSDEVSVNMAIPEEERRVPIANMIYLADGPSDIPSFSVVRKHGGAAYAVYDANSEKHFAQADELLRTDRVDAVGPADYTESSQTDMWLRRRVRIIADKILASRQQALKSRVSAPPGHIVRD